MKKLAHDFEAIARKTVAAIEKGEHRVTWGTKSIDTTWSLGRLEGKNSPAFDKETQNTHAIRCSAATAELVAFFKDKMLNLWTKVGGK